MWRFKHFAHKEHAGLEGRVIDIGNYKVQIRNIIAEGGFSCVYSARDATHISKQYALKHIICTDEESHDLVMKEVSVMKSLKGHPNVVTLNAHAFFDAGRTKEALLLMEYCEKSLVNTLDNRGAGFFEEKQILTIFRDICNAVFAMHCQTPPIAHRDLKAENLLLGSDGSWKLCDFGSTSTNHKRFEKPEEMGIEEDNIRKYTTPAYRAPEMWDLYRRELLSEKVDIWALGCLLFRICYFKLAFDGESKLQILNMNYRIPDLPKYSASLTDLIKDMLQSSPDDRPDITQVWFRVNDLLPDGLRKSLPDRPPEILQQGTEVLAGTPKPAIKSSPMPRRSPPPPPSTEAPRNVNNSKPGESSGALGAFWTTQHARDSVGLEENTKPKFDEPHNETMPTVQSDVYNNFVAEFSNNTQNPTKKSAEELEAEVEKLKEQLSRANTEKAEITSKYEKLSAICRSQRQEIHELKHDFASKTPTPIRDSSRSLQSPGSQPSSITTKNEKVEGTVWELQEGFFDKQSPGSDAQQWQAFSEDPKPMNNTPKSVRTKNSPQKLTPVGNTWGFGADNFTAVPTPTSKANQSIGALNNSQMFGDKKTMESKFSSQPAGWAGF